MTIGVWITLVGYDFRNCLSEPEYSDSSGRNFFSLGAETEHIKCRFMCSDQAFSACGIFFKAIAEVLF